MRNTTISFAPKVDVTVGSANLDMTTVDFNVDGKPDVALADYTSNTMYALANTSTPGTISFAPKTDLATNANGPRFISAGDIDGDGYTDLALTYYNTGEISLYKNTTTAGNISFSRQADIANTTMPLSLSFGNVNGDDKPDLLTSSLTSNVVSILRNRIGEPLLILLCPPVASATIAAGIAGTTYQWQADTGTGFINITDNANYSGTNAATLQLINIRAAWYGYKYSCTASGTNSSTYILQFVNSWRGTASTNWNDPANWTCGALPDGNTDVVVDAGTVTITANAICRTILVKPGATLKINPGVTLTITH